MAWEVAKVMGRSGEGKWAQVHDFVPEEGEKREKRGRLLAVVSLEGGEAGVAESGREILVRLHELYYGDMEEPAGVRLASAVGRVMEEMGEGKAEGELVAAVVMDGGLWVASTPGPGVWVRRKGGREGWIIKAQEAGLRVQEGVVSLGGKMEEGDVVVVGNGRFWQSLPTGTLRAALVSDKAEAVETIGGIVHGRGEGEGGVGAIISVTRDQLPVTRGEQEKEEKGLGWGERLKEKFKFNRGPVYVEYQDRGKTRRRLMAAGGVFLLLVAIGAGVGWSRKKQQEIRDSQVYKRVSELEYKMGELGSLVELNPQRSRQLLAEIVSELEEIKSLGAKDERLERMGADLEKIGDQVAGIKRPTLVEEVVDLGLVREGMTGERMAMREGWLLVLDADNGRVVEVNPGKKRAEVVAGQLGGAKLIAGYPGKIFILAAAGVLECRTQNTECKTVVASDSGWGEIGDMGVWAGNIYLLDSGAGQIWRYQVTDTGFGVKRAWTGESENSLSSSLNMAIDGNIWVGVRDQGLGTRILKFTRGVKQEFEVTGIERLGGDAIYTDGEAERLYVLDRAGGRVVTFGKDGLYQAQYIVDEAKGSRELVVDEKAGKMYLLGGSKIWEIPL